MPVDADPRLHDEFVRALPGRGTDHDLTLLGVVHDHPGSTFRVKTAVESIDPDVLALELPPLALPLFERYAQDGRTPPAFGGEMSTAIQALSEGDVVGIDGPSTRFFARVGRTLFRDDASVTTTRRVLGSLWSATRHAIVCRIAAIIATRIGVRVEVDSPVDHGCRWSDDPNEQAADERDQVQRARAVANALGTPDAVDLREATREAHMADRLATLRRETDVVAVLGVGHLDPLVERLDGAT